MEEFALKCNYEHPCHSIIFDSNDKCWEDVFSSEDLQEIRIYRLKQLDDLPVNFQEYIDSSKSTNKIDSLYEKVKKDDFHPLKESSCKWAQAIIYSYLKLYMFNYFPLNDQTETDIFLRIWSLIDTLLLPIDFLLFSYYKYQTSQFDHSCIDCRSGEKSSNAYADGRNIDKTIASTDQIERRLPGRKVDMLFKANSIDFGCVDCGRFGVFSNTKEQAMCALKINEPPKPMNSTVWCMDFGLISRDDWTTQLSKAATYLVETISMKDMLAVERLYSRSIVKSFLDTHTKKETRRKRAEYEDRGKNTLNDSYTDQELLRINQYFLIQNSLFSLRNKVCFSMSHTMLMRSEAALGIHLPDLFIVELKNQGPSSCFAIVATITFGKTNKDGKIQYGSTFRHRDVEVCSHGAFAQYFFFPCSITKTYHFQTSRLTVIAKIYKQVLRYCGVHSSKLTHINRKSAINMVANEGVSGDQQRQVGRWGSDRMVGRYLSGLPVDAIKVLAGFTTRKGDYFINRGSIEPSEELRKMVFPWIEHWREKFYRKEVEDDIARPNFLDLMDYLRTDSVVLKGKYPESFIWSHSIFEIDLYKDYEERLSAAIAANDEKSKMSQHLEVLLPEVAAAMKTGFGSMNAMMNIVQSQNQLTLDAVKKLEAENRTMLTNSFLQISNILR
ncbi:hypothetical protein G6F43_006495 [Rhizopus delemar]|nr:hypothetical protein G6F43_006495 [Rhizopus delemar]